VIVMTIVFQVLAAITIGVTGLVLIRGSGQKHQALRRLMMLFFIAAAAVSVFFPGAWTWVANRLGIGRGTDLLLYLLVLVFIGFTATTYRRFRQLEAHLTELARQLALQSAKKPKRRTKA
jgi:small membrane protein